MPDYSVIYFQPDDMVVFRNKGTMQDKPTIDEVFAPSLLAETYELARTEAPGWDIYFLEQEWRDWISEPPRDANRAFVGFCRKWFEKRGSPS